MEIQKNFVISFHCFEKGLKFLEILISASAT